MKRNGHCTRGSPRLNTLLNHNACMITAPGHLPSVSATAPANNTDAALPSSTLNGLV